MAATRSGRFATPATIRGQREAPPTGRFRRSVPAPGGRFARTRFGTPTALRYRHPRRKTGIAGLIERLPKRATKSTAHSRTKPAIALLAGLGAGAAALAKRRRSHIAEPPQPTYTPPAEPSMPSTPAGVGTNGTATP